MNIGLRTEWQLNLSQKIFGFQREDLLTDLTFLCSDGKVEAHRLVLGGFSDFLHQLLLESDESRGFISLPELRVDQVKCFVAAVYRGALPEDQPELFSAFIVFNLLVDSASVKKSENTSKQVDNKIHLDLGLNIEQEEHPLSEDDPVQEKTECPNFLPGEKEAEEDSRGSQSKLSAIKMTPEERLQRSTENLEKSCKFCFGSVVSHRVSLKVKQERNNSYHLKNQYVCCVCGVVLNTPSNFIAHNNNEFSKYESSGRIPSLWQFNCNLCSKTICQHQLNQQSYICCHCGEEFCSPGVLTIHLKTINTLNITECEVCKIALPKNQLRKHLAQQHPNSVSTDSFPPQLGPSAGGELQSCPDCHKVAKVSKKEKMAHYRAKHPEYYASLLKHNNQVWKSAPSSQYTFCDVCNKSIRKCNLKEHKLHTHGLNMANETVDLPTFTCDICGQVSKYAKDVKKHKKLVHERVLPFSCQYCNKKFSNKGNLNQHEVIHTGITPYQCHVCGRQCRRRGELEKHIQTHNGLNSLNPVEQTDQVFLVDSQDADRNISQLPLLVPGSSPGAGPHSLQLVSGHQLPLIMTQLDADSLRQVGLWSSSYQKILTFFFQTDLLKDLTGQTSASSGMKMPAFILH